MQHLDSYKKAAILLKDKIPFRKMLFWLVKYIKVQKYYKHYGLYKGSWQWNNAWEIIHITWTARLNWRSHTYYEYE